MRRLLYMLALSLAAMLVLAPAASAQTGGLNCGDFANQEAAQAILDANGDLYDFDIDGDGLACEDSGSGTAEDGTLAPFAPLAQSPGTAQLAETGGPSLLIPAAAGTLLLGACIVGLFLVARRSSWVGNLGGGQQMTIDLGPNAKRLAAVVLAVALAALLAVVLGSGVVGPSKSASAQPARNPLAISTAVYPSPTNAIQIGTKVDLLITEYNTSRSPARGVTVNDQLPGGT